MDDHGDASLDFTSGFEGDVLGPIRLNEAVRRTLAYCTSKGSGWGVYDLAGATARRSGVFETVTPWSLLLANALNGQVGINNVAAFDLEQRQRYAELLEALDPSTDLADMDETQIDGVVAACAFGYPGVWGPKITKVGALYRPKSIPVLDGYVAMAFGFNSEGFSERTARYGRDRWARIRATVEALAWWIRDHEDHLQRLRNEVESEVPEIKELSDLRLVDIVIWTSQDDRMSRVGKSTNRWLDSEIGQHIPMESFQPVALRK